jgi:hypothetical protein
MHGCIGDTQTYSIWMIPAACMHARDDYCPYSCCVFAHAVSVSGCLSCFMWHLSHAHVLMMLMMTLVTPNIVLPPSQNKSTCGFQILSKNKRPHNGGTKVTRALVSVTRPIKYIKATFSFFFEKHYNTFRLYLTNFINHRLTRLKRFVSILQTNCAIS